MTVRASRFGIAVIVLVVSACTASDQPGPSSPTEQAVTSTAGVGATTTTVEPATTATTSTTVSLEPPEGVTQVELADGIVAWVDPDEPTITAFRNAEMIFTLTQSCGDCFAGTREMTREPNGVLSTEGWHGGVWTVGPYGQLEINRLWPPDTPLNMDVLWLSDYTGMTADTLTGFTPEPSDVFVLYDELVLEPRGTSQGSFGLHADCGVGDGEIAAALLSFEHPTPTVLMAWTIDDQSMTFTQLDDLELLTVGNCLEPEPRPAS